MVLVNLTNLKSVLFKLKMPNDGVAELTASWGRGGDSSFQSFGQFTHCEFETKVNGHLLSAETSVQVGHWVEPVPLGFCPQHSWPWCSPQSQEVNAPCQHWKF